MPEQDPYAAIAKPVNDDPYAAIAKPLTQAAPASIKDQPSPTIAEGLTKMVTSFPPITAARGLYEGGKRIAGEIGQAGQAAKEGNMPGVASHAISAIPFLGPELDKGAEAAQERGMNKPGNTYGQDLSIAATTPGTLGHIAKGAAEVAPLALGALDTAAPERSLIGQIPSRARAGAMLQDIRTQAANVPVSTTNTAPEVARYQELAQRGGSTAKPITQLAPRIRENMVPNINTKPINFPEARDFYSNVSSQSAEDASRLNPIMRTQMGSVRAGLHQDLTDAAGQIGRGEDYSNAIREYARAMQMRKGLITAAKIGIPAAGAGIAGHYIKNALPSR